MTTPENLRASARRARAAAEELRALAARLDRSHVHELSARAADGTWMGPTATELQAAVARGRRELDLAAGELRRQAVRLDQEAVDLERAAAQAQVLTPALG